MEIYKENSIESEKGMSRDLCIDKAHEFIAKNGVCLFLIDLVGSTGLSGESSSVVFNRYDEMVENLNDKFVDNLPEHNLVNGDEEQGFRRILGDGVVGGVDSHLVVSEIIDYIEGDYSDISLRYGVAQDGWDEEGIGIIK